MYVNEMQRPISEMGCKWVEIHKESDNGMLHSTNIPFFLILNWYHLNGFVENTFSRNLNCVGSILLSKRNLIALCTARVIV